MILTWLSMVAAVNNASASCRVAQIIMNQTAQINVMERLMHRDSARMGAERVVYAGIAPFFGVRSTHLRVGGSRPLSRVFLSPANLEFEQRFSAFAEILGISASPPIAIPAASAHVLATIFSAIWPLGNSPVQGHYFAKAVPLHSEIFAQIPEARALVLLAQDPSNLEAAQVLLENYPPSTRATLLVAIRATIANANQHHRAVDLGKFIVDHAVDSAFVSKLVSIAAASWLAGATLISIPLVDSYSGEYAPLIFVHGTGSDVDFQMEVPSPADSAIPEFRFGPEFFARLRNVRSFYRMARFGTEEESRRLAVLEQWAPRERFPRGRRRTVGAPAINMNRIIVDGREIELVDQAPRTRDQVGRLAIFTGRERDIELFNLLARVTDTAQFAAYRVLSPEGGDPIGLIPPGLDRFETYFAVFRPFHWAMQERFPELTAFSHLVAWHAANPVDVTPEASLIARRAALMEASAILSKRHAASSSYALRILNWIEGRSSRGQSLDINTFFSAEAIDADSARSLGELAAVAWLATGRNVILPYAQFTQRLRLEPMLLFGDPASLSSFHLSIPAIEASSVPTIEIRQELIAAAFRSTRLRRLLNPRHPVYTSRTVTPDETAGFRARLLEIEQLLSRGRTR